MSILILNSSFPPQIGGVESYMLEVATALAPEGVEVVAPDVAGAEAFDAQAPFRILRHPDVARSIGYRDAWARLRRGVHAVDASGSTAPPGNVAMASIAVVSANRHMLKRAAAQCAALDASVQPEVTLAGTALASGIPALLLRERHGIPYGVFTHAAELLEWSRTRRLGALLGRVLRGASAVGAVSAYTRRLVEGLGVPGDRIVMTAPGIDPRPFVSASPSPALRERFGLGSGPVVLSHGRLDPRKGNDVLVRAFADVIRRVPSAKLLITGTGECAGALETQIVSSGLTGHVVLGGYVDSADLPALYATCDVFVMASRQIGQNVEGFGIVLLEAAAAGKPVLGGASGGVADALADGETGYLVDPTSPDDLARRLVLLLEDDQRRRELGARGRRRVLDGFDRDAFSRRVHAVVARLRADRRGRKVPARAGANV